jgi:glycosyltransferase involved in cell wall biosynthesis
MKTILIITDNTKNQINGVTTTYNNIEKLTSKEFNVKYITPDDFFNIPTIGYPEVKFSFPFSIGSKIDVIAPSYINIATEGPVGIAAKIYLDSNNINYTTAYHTKFPEFLKELYYIPLVFTKSYLNWFHRKSKAVLTTTPTMVTELKSILDNKNIVPWTRGVDRAVLYPTIERPHNIVAQVLYVGRVSKEKNLDALCNLHNKFMITIVGDGPYRKELELKYPNIRFKGYLQGSDLANEYLKANVFAFPSKTDTFGIVMIEALSFGVPVAAFPVQGPLDIIDQEKTGFMHTNLEFAIMNASLLYYEDVLKYNKIWSWQECYKIFKDNLIHV